MNGPIEQNIFGKGGVYECMHIQKKSMTLEEYQIKTGVFDKITKNMPTEEVEQMVGSKIIVVLEKYCFFPAIIWSRSP